MILQQNVLLRKSRGELRVDLNWTFGVPKQNFLTRWISINCDYVESHLLDFYLDAFPKFFRYYQNDNDGLTFPSISGWPAQSVHWLQSYRRSRTSVLLYIPPVLQDSFSCSWTYASVTTTHEKGSKYRHAWHLAT